MGFETFIVSRYLKSPRKDRSVSVITKISIFGVAIGVMALIVALSVMNGFETDLRGALERANAHVTTYTLSQKGFFWEKEGPLMEKIRSHADPVAAAPFISNQALILGKNRPMGTLIRGIDPDLEIDVTRMDFFIRTELFDVKRDNTNHSDQTASAEVIKAKKILSLLAPHVEQIEDSDGTTRNVKTSGIIIGSQLAKNLGVDINDYITIVTPEERITPMGNMPRAKKFRVVGFFESGLMGYDEILTFIHIDVAKKIYKMRDRVTGISIRLNNGDKADEVKEVLQEKIGFPYVFSSWIEQNRNLFTVFRLEKFGLAIILTLIILIAAFNIISSLVMLVIEKNHDIAILKTMGATNRSIRRIFMTQGAIIGLTGTIVGEILGVVTCWLISNFDVIDIPAGVYVGNRIPMDMRFWQIALIAVISFLICLIVTVFPSQNAAKMTPVDGLRYE